MSSLSPRVTRLAGRRARAGLLRVLNIRQPGQPGSCGAQHERPNAKRIYLLPGSMLGPEMNAGLDAEPIQKMCGADSVPGPDFLVFWLRCGERRQDGNDSLNGTRSRNYFAVQEQSRVL